MHSLLTLGAAHQEAGHSLSWKEGVGLRDLGGRGGCALHGSVGKHLVTGSQKAVIWWQALAKEGQGFEEQGVGVLDSQPWK